MNTKILAKVNNVAIEAIEESRGKLIPIKPICEALGIDESAQRRKLRDDDFLCSTAVLSTAVAADGKQREMLCLPFEFIFGWLFTINPGNVKEEARAAVSRYRIECYRVLFRHFALRSEFIAQKNEDVERAIALHENIRAEFHTAKRRMKEAENELNRVRKITFEEWRAKNRQLELF
jgi:hypothetical protein